jgi:hypothetical protein
LREQSFAKGYPQAVDPPLGTTATQAATQRAFVNGYGLSRESWDVPGFVDLFSYE